MSDQISVTGRVATEPHRVERSEGAELVTFRLATSAGRVDAKTGKWAETGTNWYTVNVWRTMAGNALASLRKGQQVVLRGRLDLQVWRDDAGKDRVSPTIHADSLGHDLRWGTTALVAAGTEPPRKERADEWHVAEAGVADVPF